MLVKLKRGLRRARDSLRNLFRSRKPIEAQPKQYLKYADWDGLRACSSLLMEHAETFGPLTSAIGRLARDIETFENQAGTREEYNKLGSDMNDLLRVLSGYLDGGASTWIPQARIKKLADAIDKETEPLRQGNRGTGAERHAETMVDASQVLKCYRRVQMLLGQFVLNESKKIWKISDEAAFDARLNQLPHSPAAEYHSTESARVRRHGCTPNTRVDILQQLQDWQRYNDDQKICWLSGMAGTGKTTIAYSLCKQLESAGKLAASFFCSRGLPTCRDSRRILPSISHQLALKSRPFQSVISTVLEQNPKAHELPFSEQLEMLVIAPLHKVKHTFPSNMVIVIDALDGCEDTDGVDRIVDALFTHASDLPVKFFVTCRPSRTVMDRIGSEQRMRLVWELRLDEVDHSIVQKDIRTYMVAEQEHLNLSTNIDSLVQQSGVLFLYADMLAGYTRHGSLPGGTERLKQLLDTLTLPEIDLWYTTILHGILDDSALESRKKDQIMLVLRAVVYAREPLTVDKIADLLGVDPIELLQDTLPSLWSVLQVSDTKIVTTLHSSLPSHILDRRRSTRTYDYIQRRYTQLALSCFDLIRQPSPPFNICHLESSYVRDQEVPDIAERVNKAISKELLHACRHWAIYLELAPGSEEVLNALHNFLATRLLVWMEILNLTRYMRDGAEQLRRLNVWLKGIEPSDNLRLLTRDARSFMTAFLWSPLSDSTPHIYVSMLAFWQKDRPVSTHYVPRMAGLVKVTSSGEMSRTPVARKTLSAGIFRAIYSPDDMYIAACIGREVRILDAHTGQPVGQPLTGHTGQVWSVAYSPDGAYIVSGSRDETIRIWDVRTGQLVLQPLVGHTSDVTSVAYSPSGAHIVSGSWDKTIRIWDVRTGHLVGRPLEGHSDSASLVAYSPDGAYIMCDSKGVTIRIWDARTGQPVRQPLEGHTRAVMSAAYSPDGAYIASGSVDKAVRIWDAHTGQPVGQPLEGHTGLVRSVAYSPDGAYVVSGSQDKTIRIWDARIGQPVCQPLKGHTYDVSSVAYSSDGAHILSGSGDNTIRIWDAHTAQTSSQTCESHTHSVSSVAYSPDSAYIVSGSSDNTIRIWDAHTGQPVLQPLAGHTGRVNSVAYSPDGAYIVSASVDKTIRIWDAHTGEPVGQPLEGHAGSVNSATFSPNGAHIRSHSSDKTIRIWDAYTRQPISQPSQGYKNLDSPVACSPDCAYIMTRKFPLVCIWDAHTGEPIGEPFDEYLPDCPVCSPDGAHIAFGVYEIIHIRDTRTGQPVLQPFVGHTGRVNSLAYSPNGAYIVSGSSDSTVRVWDAHTGQPVLQPLVGHTGSVNSVAYSPNGAYIVSGADDKTIRIWDAGLAQPVGLLVVPSTGPLHSAIHPPNHAHVSPGDHTRTLETTFEPATNHLTMPPVALLLNDWALNKEGWVVNANQDRLVWVPPHSRDTLLRPRNKAIVCHQGTVSLDLHDAKLGENWKYCFDPSQVA